MTDSMSNEVVVAVDGHAGRLRLNRPRQIHALSLAMCEAMLAALDEWRTDPQVAAVLIDHAEGRGFCAGGDIRALTASGAAGGAEARRFFRTEYQLNHRLFTFAKPTVSFMDGVTMGGGVGLALPCRYRIATENTRFAMPEVAIGLFPDVGGGWYLSRMAGRIGQYLALTGARLDGAECVALGLATHYLPSETLEETKRRIAADPRALEAVLDELSVLPPDASLLSHRADIERLFASDRLEDILAALDADGGAFARQTLATLRTRAPLSMKVGLKLLLDGHAMPTFEDEMRQEFAVAAHIVQRPDFAEGVRAVIVDKDKAPRWDPATPEAVSDHLIDRIFAPLDEADAWDPA